MRRALAGVALAVTSMVALSFLIPLALVVRAEARARAITVAEQRAAALAPVLALTTRPADVQQAVDGLDPGQHLGVHLPGAGLIGSAHAPADALRTAARDRGTLALDTAGGWVYVQPVILGEDRVAVVEAFVPRADLTRGVAVSWTVMSVLAVGLVAGSVAVADRLGARVVRSSRGLSRASHALGKGDLDVRVLPAGPPELQEAGVAFNSMADRVAELLSMERELVADLSHRLRTPLTALRLEAERMGVAPGADRIAAAVGQLESELDTIIKTARTPLAIGPAAEPGADTCEAADVVRARTDFWSVLAAQQGRRCRVEITAEPTPVALAADDLAAVVDALIGNVFRHTAEGAAFTVCVERITDALVELTVDDAGPGIADPRGALARGVSVGGSTGLGLDIARRAATTTGGSVGVDTGPMGGARVRVTLGRSSRESRSPASTRDPSPRSGRRRRSRAVHS